MEVYHLSICQWEALTACRDGLLWLTSGLLLDLQADLQRRTLHCLDQMQ